MSDSPPPTDAPAPPVDAPVAVAVVRSGGIAGIRRRWGVEPSPSDAGEWIALIDRCPWGDASPEAKGADRFVWSIRVRTPTLRRTRELSDSELAGPWRELVDAVRHASAEPPPEETTNTV